MDLTENSITVGGITRSSRAYGDDYLTELRRVLTQHVKPVTRAWLEWGAGNTTLAIHQLHETLPVDDFFSIDNSQAYLDELAAQLPPWNGFHPVCLDLVGPKLSDRDLELAYSTWPLSLGRVRLHLHLMGAGGWNAPSSPRSSAIPRRSCCCMIIAGPGISR